MLQNDIRRADAVRHMSVDAGTRTADRADSHGHRPQNRLTCPNTQGRPLPGDGTRPSGIHPKASDLPRTHALPRLGRVSGAAAAAHWVWLMRQEPGGRPNATPEITKREVSASAVETAGLAARRVSIVA
jgi:hypothetical protein